jgi:EpsI family protein
VPERSSFIGFPSSLDQWTVGHRGAIEQVYLDVLKLDDYIMTDYERAGVPPVQLYVAWYDSQRAGLSAHSPRTCIPGGGWTIDSMDQYTVPGVTVGAQPLRVNRILISNHDQRELVYYWFQQRGRVMTNEYLVKWYMFVDSILRNRTDGAMVRLVIPVTQAFPVESGQRDLDAFVRSIESRLGAYIPQ